jgi:DNA-binding NarL/FixJ family response regulator
MVSSAPLKVLVCNKYSLFREGLRALLQQGVLMDVVAEVSTASEAIQLTRRLKPHVVLLDATTTDMSGAESTRRIKAIDPSVQVVIVSMNDDELLRSSCVEAGAAGYIGSEDQVWQLKKMITKVCDKAHEAPVRSEYRQHEQTAAV